MTSGRRYEAGAAPVARESLTPAERALREVGGPTYFEIGRLEPPSNSVSAFAPDDWRLYYLMRELPVADRVQVLRFAEMLYNLRHAMDWADESPGEAATAPT
jgi:hypothetical protein